MKSRVTSHRLLILGGTFEARKFSAKAQNKGYECITSLAGRTDNPLLPDGKTRIGSFGGVGGLVNYIKQKKINCLIDATHPFAQQISDNAVKAAQKTAIQVLRLEREAWQESKGDDWLHVQTLEKAIDLLPHKARVFITIGRQKLHQFLKRKDLTLFARTIEQPDFDLPGSWILIKKRPPYTLENELAFFKNNKIDILVTKNAGGSETSAKLTAARKLQKKVIMIKRLKKLEAETYHTVDDMLDRLNTL